ncbi:hypothetical protein QE152_g25409 [Popillia japonica]|uniref:Uncharacterized protein n=1 Tax=Popillia japonica TaxID=7064 RepID=A0AAW1K180_POPJA
MDLKSPNTKIVNCERFLEKNRLISMDLKSPRSSSEDTDTFVFPDRLASDKCCQTSSIESYLKITFAENIAKNKSEARRRNLEQEKGTKTRTGGGHVSDDKNEAYFDSLDESSGSVGSEVFKDDNIPVKDTTTTDAPTRGSNKSLKAKQSKSNMLYQRSSEDGFSEDSVVDGCENYHSHALSVSRIERGLRKCSSDVCLRKSSDTIFATSCTEVDLRKLASYECTSIRSVNKYEDVNLTSDEILEIAGEQFLQCLRNNPQIKTSTPISQRKAPACIGESPPSDDVNDSKPSSSFLNVSDCVPVKKRKLEECPKEGGQELDTELRRNIEQIKEKKEKLLPERGWSGIGYGIEAEYRAD